MISGCIEATRDDDIDEYVRRQLQRERAGCSRDAAAEHRRQCKLRGRLDDRPRGDKQHATTTARAQMRNCSRRGIERRSQHGEKRLLANLSVRLAQRARCAAARIDDDGVQPGELLCCLVDDSRGSIRRCEVADHPARPTDLATTLTQSSFIPARYYDSGALDREACRDRLAKSRARAENEGTSACESQIHGYSMAT